MKLPLYIFLSLLCLLKNPGYCDSQDFFVRANGTEVSLIEGADFSKLADFASPAVVDLETETENNIFLNDPFFQPFFWGADSFSGKALKQVVKSSGSGVIISANGLMLSCAHVVENTQKIIACLADGRKFDVKVLAVCEEIDLAILQIVEIGAQKLPFLKLGISKTVVNGKPVAALGNSFSLGQNFTDGIISAKNRRLRLSTHSFAPAVIQHNAAVNPGNSGGALVDQYGNLIGINNAIYSKSGGSNGVGFAIPVDFITAFLKKYFSQTGDKVHPFVQTIFLTVARFFDYDFPL